VCIAAVAELVDALDSGSSRGNSVDVRVISAALLSLRETMTYSRTHPFPAHIKSRYRLTKDGSQKMTHHVIIDLGDSGIQYTVGDSIGIYPENHPEVVAKTLQVLKCDPETTVQDKKTGEQFPLIDYLKKKANLRAISRKLLELTGRSEMTKEELQQYEVWDFMEAFLPVPPSAQDFCDMAMPLLPRLYSIASSPLLYPNEVHLTVAPVHYKTRGQLRYGVATDFLCYQAEIEKTTFGVYLQPHHGFTIPENPKTDMIMVGPGTGVAPYRAFLQQRAAEKNTARHWLFFGEWNCATDFFYEEEWKELSAKIDLRVNAAFSRDQVHKVYVQQLLKEHSKELFDWIERGAIFYVCGDADKMAKDVDKTLHEIIKENTTLDDQGVRNYVKQLRTENRYLRDIY
jgi:sulfite reductase (NADPH) flavoprotein alpha-component